MFSYKLKKTNKRKLSPLLELGFHGDKYLLQLVDSILLKSNYFIETGTNVGSTLAYVARNYPEVKCISCEPHIESYEKALQHCKQFSNVSLYNNTSQEFIEIIRELRLNDKNILFWLDAHGYGFKWPLKEEIAFITSSFPSATILIDDFKVPHLDCFGYDAYKSQECSLEYIAPSLNPNLKYSLIYPNYTEQTSPHHPLRGWCLINHGNNNHDIPNDLEDKLCNTFYPNA